MDKSELPEDITALIKEAEAGDATAQFNLGVKYRKGYTVEQSNQQALKWFRKAAKQKHVQAQNNIGFMYLHGCGVKLNAHRAVAWFRKAAEQGHATAQYNLGGMFMLGAGIEKNYAKAQELFRKAASSKEQNIRFNSIESLDQVERHIISPEITKIRSDILNNLKVNIDNNPTMTHYTSLFAGEKIS